MKRPYRFTLPRNLKSNGGHRAIRKFAGKYKGDQLRSQASAKNSLRRTVQLSGLHWRFDRCLTDEGYKDAIGFKCGRHKESAACTYCRRVARVRKMELFVTRPDFKRDCIQLTIVDAENEVFVGNLYEYAQEAFLDRIRSIIKSVSKPIKLIGQIEYQIRENDDEPVRKWSPHVHLIVTGRGRDEFITACRKQFRSSRYAGRPVLAKPLRKRSDVLRAAAYQFKSSYARRRSSPALTSEEKTELNEFLLEKSCSDLLIMQGVNFRNARVQISSERDLKIWNAVHGIPSFFEERYDRRIVPSVDYELRRKLFDSRGDLRLDKLDEHIQVITEQLRDV